MKLIDNSLCENDLIWIAFKFGYMHGKRVEQIYRTGKANGKRTAGEADQCRKHIDELMAKLQQRFAPGIERCTLPRVQRGKHKRAYIDWNSNVTNQEDEKR